MTKWFYTGSREPRDGFTLQEIHAMQRDFLGHVAIDDEFGHGGCDGADEVLAVLCRDVGYRAICFRPTRPRAPGRGSQLAIELATEVRMVDGDELDRNTAGIAWADQVRALPLHPWQVLPDGCPQLVRYSGTNYTARYAHRAGKLHGWQAIRDA